MRYLGGLAAVRWQWGAAAFATLAIAAAAVAVLRRLRRRSPEEEERLRRAFLNRIGRIAGGEIIDLLPAPIEVLAAAPAPVVVYEYSVGGVTYQVSQALHLVKAEIDPRSWIPGWPVQVKFDPANPGNSIIACEGWQGLRAPRAAAAGQANG